MKEKISIKEKFGNGWKAVLKSKLNKDFARLIPLIAIAGFTVVPDNSRGVVFFSIGILVIMAALSHLLRKILFPYADLQLAWTKAHGTPLGAAIVFASISGIITATILGGIMLLK